MAAGGRSMDVAKDRLDLYACPVRRGDEIVTWTAPAPAELTDWANFCQQAASRFPGIQAWEVWNEQNAAVYGMPSVQRYFDTLAYARSGLRQGNGAARVVLGGLADGADSPYLQSRQNFLRDLFAIPWGSAIFDAIGVHVYAHNAQDNPQKWRDTRNWLNGKVPSSVQLWINEFGKSYVPPEGSPDIQKTWEQSTSAAWVGDRASYGLGPLAWFALRDGDKPLGIWNSNSSERPAGSDFAARARGGSGTPVDIALPPVR
jgi:hypothetical protein